MKTLHIKIYEFANRDLESELATVAQIFQSNTGVKLNFTVEEKTGTPTWYEDREGVFYVTKQWLTKNAVDDAYDICIALFNDQQWREKHNNTIGGTAEASPLNGTGLIYMTATEGQTKTLKEGGKEYTEMVWRLLHELSHVCYDDLMERPDLDKTHWWDYEQENLFGALQGIDLSDYTPKKNRNNTTDFITKRHLTPLSDFSWPENKKTSIILHTLLGSIEGSYSWLKEIQLSYNYLIDTDGTIYEQIPPHRAAWHAGFVFNPTKKAQKFYTDNPNKNSIGIAFARKGERDLTKKQVASGVKLIRHLGNYNADNIFSHVDITSYKPSEVRNYRSQVLNVLTGEKGSETEQRIREKQSQVLTLMSKWLKNILNSIQNH